MKTEFVYIDSSQEQTQNQQNTLYNRKNTCPQHCSVGFNIDLCSLPQTNYDVQLRNLLSKANQEVKKTKGKIKKGNKQKIERQLEQNIDKRQSNYQYFVWKMQIDKKYQQIMDQKVIRLKFQNERKKKILSMHKAEEKAQNQKNLLKNYTIKKKQNETKIINRLQKQVRKLGVQRVNIAHEKVKQKLQEHKVVKQNELISKQSKHRNELEELKQKYESLKEQKRLNKIDQKKVIKQLQSQVCQKKKYLAQKLKKSKDFKL